MEDCLFLGAAIFFVTKDREAFKNGQKKTGGDYPPEIFFSSLA